MKTVLICTSIIVGCLIFKITDLQSEKNELKEQIEYRDRIIMKNNKELYDRFVIANDLTEICNRFKSSREAKEKYYFDGTL